MPKVDFNRARIPREQAMAIAVQQNLGASDEEIQDEFGVRQGVLETSEEIKSAKLSLLSEMRQLARKNLRGHLDMMATIRDEARVEGKYAAAVQAEKCRGQVLGYYDRSVINDMEKESENLDNLSVEELTHLLETLEEDNRKALKHEPKRRNSTENTAEET